MDRTAELGLDYLPVLHHKLSSRSSNRRVPRPLVDAERVHNLGSRCLFACSCVILLLPDLLFLPMLTDAVALSATVLWFAGAFLARQQIQQHYARREGSEFHLSLPLTAFFTVFYLNFRIRAEFSTQAQSLFPR